MIYSYRRVSTDEQQNGPQAQADAIQRWLSGPSVSLAMKQPDADFFDNGVSGSVPLGNRPKGGEMLRQLRRGDIVVVSKLDRLFRSVSDAASTIDAWGKAEIKLVAIGEGFDMSNPYGKAMCQMASVFAELERAMIRQRTREGLAAKRRRGEKLGGPPYGWYREGGKLVVHEGEQHTIEIIKRFSGQGMQQDEIAARLDGLSIRTRKGGKWRQSIISKILARAACLVS